MGVISSGESRSPSGRGEMGATLPRGDSMASLPGIIVISGGSPPYASELRVEKRFLETVPPF